MIVDKKAYVVWRPKNGKVIFLAEELDSQDMLGESWESETIDDSRIYFYKDMAQDEADFQNKYGDIRQRIENGEETEDNIWRVKEFKIQF